MVKKLLGCFMKKNFKKQIKKNLEWKVIKKKGDKLYVKWKGYDNSFNSWINKKRYYVKVIQYFPKPYEPFVGNVKVELDLSNYYATKADLKGATGIDAFNVALNSNLAKFKAEVNKIYVDKLKTVPDDLSKLSNVVNNEAVKKKNSVW